ncbi:uncharacterized protein E0L32_011992 [Thyridium curvatum]|uniref:Uncharacterized protein n=1 Tax=Thyridium curvatum TaxID=1093900 RepID=A0A507BKF2_9PEZI|nr:uncharacterized protein E0L32_011992 [Thyridium curvatum]TPX17929.1 hypothetical protein E0L32_011992 [Thyridium curvatum]
MRIQLASISAIAFAGAGAAQAAAAPLVSEAGQRAPIPSWDLQSSAKAGDDLSKISQASQDTSSWHHADVSRCTVMACLIKAGVYNDSELFYSDNLDRFDASPFRVPWIYRSEFALQKEPAQGRHFFLHTHGITSCADVFLNGKEVANKTAQAGAYGGHVYDVSELVVADGNALAVRAYPTDYQYDFGVGFVDWNPSPPDNGTGVWREVVLRQTGPVSLGDLRIVTALPEPVGSSAYVTLKATARNLEDHEVTFVANGDVSLADGGSARALSNTYTVGPKESVEINLTTDYANPPLWWPKPWGEPTLHKAQVTVSVDGAISDKSEEKKFGLRTVSSVLNKHNDTQFFVNGHPFQVLGGGYSSDMFLRFDPDRFTTEVKYMLDMGQNTVRLEGKMEHPELYEIADSLGLMVIAGWECCDKFEAWKYNEDLPVNPPAVWSDADYDIAKAQMLHEAAMMQNHPSMLAFLVGSDYWPDDRATAIYVDAAKAADLDVPIIASASKRSYPKALGPSGMKMDGPYDWVPPNYWWDTEPADERLGSSFGFGSELGAGVGTPELNSLKRFLSAADMDDLWRRPDKGLYHMSTKVSSFYDRKIYNGGLWRRYGAPASLEDYLLKAQMADYEATRAQYEGYAGMWSAGRPATGLIYWMLSNAWPSLHWNQYDYYLHVGGSFYGSKVGSRMEHVAYDYVRKSVWLIDRHISNPDDTARTVSVELLGLDGKAISTSTISARTGPNASKNIGAVKGVESIKDVGLLRLVLSDSKNITISRNVYWLSKTMDKLDWDDSSWYHTPVTQYVDFTALNRMKTAEVSVSTKACGSTGKGRAVVLENQSDIPAVFIRVNLVTKGGQDVTPVYWSDNYVTLWPHEKMELKVKSEDLTGAIQVSGKNVKKFDIEL